MLLLRLKSLKMCQTTSVVLEILFVLLCLHHLCLAKDVQMSSISLNNYEGKTSDIRMLLSIAVAIVAPYRRIFSQSLAKDERGF